MHSVFEIPAAAVDAILDGLTDLGMREAAAQMADDASPWQPHPLHFLRLDELAEVTNPSCIEVPAGGLRWYSTWHDGEHDWWALDVLHPTGRPQDDWKFMAAWTGEGFRRRLTNCLEMAAAYDGEARLLVLPAFGMEMVWLAPTGAITGGMVFDVKSGEGGEDFGKAMERLHAAASHAMKQDLILQYYNKGDDHNPGSNGGPDPPPDKPQSGGGGAGVIMVSIPDARNVLEEKKKLSRSFDKAFHRPLTSRQQQKTQEPPMRTRTM